MHGMFSPRNGWVFAFVLILELILTPIAAPPRQVSAAVDGTEHCTDTDVALRRKRSDPDNKRDIPAEAFGGSPILVRPDSPFVIYYTETDAAQAIKDPAPDGVNTTSAGNYDEDNDDVPDFVERVQSCLTEAYERYRE